jgi:hypothetical protein
MTRRVVCSAIALAVVLSWSPERWFIAHAGLQALGQQARPVFRSNADLVTVPVFVKGNADDVADLRPADFALTDNGVPQRVDSFTTEAMPVDVTVLVETSHAFKDYANSVNKHVRTIASRVRPGDRLEILGIDDYVNVLLPFGPPDRPFDVDEFPRGGMASVYDALVAALLREADPDRQHLVIAITDTIDTMSTLPMAAVREAARQSSATLVLSWVTMAVEPSSSMGAPPPWMTSAERVARHIGRFGPAQRTVPRRQQWTPHYDPPPMRDLYAFDVLRGAADLTGGGLHIGGFIERNSAIVFNKVYAGVRKNVVLRYRPEGVARDGWHDVTVTVPRHPKLDLRARRGYFVEAESEAARASPGATATAPGTFEALRLAAGNDDLTAVREVIDGAADAGTLASLIADFRAAGNIWPATPRREFVTALALADRAVRSSSGELADAGVALLARYAPLVRPPLGPDAFERLWLSASALLLQASARPAAALQLLETALSRMPDAPRLLLARAIVADTFVTGSGVAGPTALAQAAQQLLGFYDLAITNPEVAVEARVHKALLLQRLGRNNEAAALPNTSAGRREPVGQDTVVLFTQMLSDLNRQITR